MLKAYLAMLIFVFSVRSICETGEEHAVIMNAYRQLPDKKFLGAGSFGSVRLFPHDGKVYAVKKIALTPHRVYRQKIKEMNSASLKEEIEKIDEELDENYYFEDDFSKEDIEALLLKNTSKQHHMPFLRQYINHMLNIAGDVNTEMRINRKLGTAQLDNPDRMKLNFNFCVRDSGYVYYLFQDKYGEPLDSDDSKEYFKSLKTQERFNLYKLMLKRLKFIHDQGVVHCDIKGSNILWTDETHTDVVFVDYGIAVYGKDEMCSGGTYGYRAPEIVTDEEVADLEQNSFKADIYSLGALIAELESTRNYPDNSFIYAKAKLEDKNMLLEGYYELMVKLDSWISKVSRGYAKARPDLKENFAYLYGQINQVLRALLNPDYARRPNLNRAYRYIWHLSQLARKVLRAPEDFKSFVINLDRFLHNYPNKDDYFTLPDDAPAALSQPAEKGQNKQNVII